MRIFTWNEFLALCKEAWASEGQGSNDIQLVHSYLRRCEKQPRMTLVQVAAGAYKLYQSEKGGQKVTKDGQTIMQMSVSDYAAQVGITAAGVTKQIRSGNLPEGVQAIPFGRFYLIEIRDKN